MPIKLPKTFARRKSSGNVLDEVQAGNNRDSSSSFRVLARPNSSGRSLDAGNTLKHLEVAPQPPQKTSFELDNEDLFSVARNDAANRGSGGTSNSLSTAPYDSGASSSRLSTTSTNPSSVDTGSGKNVKHNFQPLDDIPTPPPHTSRGGFLKNAGRTFSFGINRNQSREVNEAPPVPALPDKNRRDTITNSRERAMTESSVTTATPPRLDESSFSIRGSEEDDFGNMFAGIAHKSSRENLTSMKPAPLRSAPRPAPPPPIHVNNSTHVDSSPYSWTSQNSRDGLMGSPSPSRTVIHTSQPSTLRKTTMNSVSESEDNMFDNSPLRRSPEAIYNRTQYSPSRSPQLPHQSSYGRNRGQSNATSVRHQTDHEDEIPPFDSALMANAQLATRYEQNEMSPVLEQQKKVMTPAEFERYRQQKEDTRRYNKVFGKTESDDGSGDDYDDEEDDDEREREAQAVQQRKKQEAHLAVYRQQMMKVTGDAPILNRSGSSMSGYGMGDASIRMSTMTLGPQPVIHAPEEDEDEDVPLGILAAHGFPNKNRAPARLAVSHSNPNLRNLAQTQGGAAQSTTGEGRLPAFARNLPADPYFGAGLVHQSERAPLQMHASPSQTHLATQPQASGSSTAHPLHPAGLVGVIAGEERARAMRRGSPNPQGGYELPMGIPQPRQSPQMQMNGFPQGMMQPGQMTPTEHAQMQMSQQMTQMMQMQMQWMQQMSGMMGQNPNMPMPMPMPMAGMPGMPPMPGMMPHQPGTPMARPQSTPLQGLMPSRTMSSLAPSMVNWNSAPMIPQIHQNGSVYAHSIAPSERSNVGLASRYRPVSTVIQEPENMYANKRASTFTSTTFRPWQNENHSTSKLAQSTVRPVADDDDDEQGWAEMQARKQKKQKSWKLRKGNKDTSLQELYNAPA